MSLASYRLRGQPQQKIRPEHLDRAAVVYVRQSSRQQVLEHSESTRLQYALAGRAVALGWARSQVVVIDDDLGVSAATADSRKGFARLVTEVTMGRVGVVLGIEMSRLARTGRDWHQLLELCSLSGTLLADPDGVYDPGVLQRPAAAGAEGHDERGIMPNIGIMPLMRTSPLCRPRAVRTLRAWPALPACRHNPSSTAACFRLLPRSGADSSLRTRWSSG